MGTWQRLRYPTAKRLEHRAEAELGTAAAAAAAAAAAGLRRRGKFIAGRTAAAARSSRLLAGCT
jgi:hypothetical protein